MDRPGSPGTRGSVGRPAHAGVLLEDLEGRPGWLSYVVARDPNEPDALWVTEVWADDASHRASLDLPAVRGAIAQGRPLIAAFGERHETDPIGGHGVATS